MKIYLFGMTGAGKSTFGRQLALKFKYPFLDLDEYIVSETNKTIPQIFEEGGESLFREIEKKHLHQASENKTDIVIATGGGTPCFFDNMEFMNEQGSTIFLNISAQEIATRLAKANNEHRPMLKDKSANEIELFIAEKLAERIKFYQESQVEILDPNINLEYLRGMLF